MVSENGLVRSVERVTALLELLSARKAPLRLVEIAQALDIPKSTAHGLLQTLLAKDFVTRDEDRYRLSMRLFSLAATALELVDLRELARPAMQELSASTHRTCNLAVLDGHDVLYIEKVEDGNSLVRLVTHVGTRVPAHPTSLGKALVGALPQQERERWINEHTFEKVTDRTVDSPEAFRVQLLEQAERGYAVDHHELHEAITGWAATVQDHTGTTVAALSLSHLGTELSAAASRDIGQQIIKAARRVSEALHTPGR